MRPAATTDELHRLMALMTGDEKRSAAATSTLDVLHVLNRARSTPWACAAVGALAPEHAASPTVTMVEPYLAGTSARVVAEALAERPHRQVMLGTRREECHRYGTRADHDAAHGLDARGICERMRSS